MRRRDPKPPVFFWQGLLIVLPVVVLATLGLVSLRQDRRLAEQEALQRARELLQQWSPEIGRRAAGELSRFQNWAEQWSTFRTRWRPVWPRNENVELWKTQATNLHGLSNEWHTAFPELNPDQMLFAPALIEPGGQALVPRLWSAQPNPPEWFAGLTGEQAVLWHQARALEVSGPTNTAAEAWQAFLSAKPRAAGLANADFALLRLSIRTQAPAAAVQRLCAFTESHSAVETESGLPLSAVGFAVALRLGERAGLSEALYRSLAHQVFNSPSLLTPYFLIEGERLARNEPDEVRDAMAALQEGWLYSERWRSLVQALGRSVSLAGIVTSNLWLQADSGRWWVILSPSTGQRAGPVDAATVPALERGTSVSFFPETVVRESFAQALRNATNGWPPYLEAGVEFAGELMAGCGPGSGKPALATLATVASVLSYPSTAGEQAENNQPVFKFSAYLSNPGALYSRQNQRSLWFGALILVAAGTAVLGCVRARRAFFREHQLSELKTNFVSSVSHELRAPIASVRLMAESLERGKVAGRERQGAYFRFMVQECRRLSSLVANLLDFSRIEQGRKEYEFEPTDLVQLVRETIQLMAPHATEREVALEELLPEPSARVTVQPVLDGRAVQQALVNLIDNALKHSSQGGTVTVGLQSTTLEPASPEQDGDAAVPGPVRLWVQDQGPGIPLAEQERIFERFYRCGSELRRDTQGVGIGLSIVKHIVEAHRGRVLVDSAPGQGSRFTLELPGR